jgi:hypothetical protein
MASHSTQIPEAVRIAASVDPSISQELKQEALAYLVKVKDLGEETWQVSDSSYIVIPDKAYSPETCCRISPSSPI